MFSIHSLYRMWLNIQTILSIRWLHTCHLVRNLREPLSRIQNLVGKKKRKITFEEIGKFQEGLPSQSRIGAEHISFCTICLSHPNIWAFSSWRKLRVLIEIPLPQVTEQDDHALHSEASQPSWSIA